MKALLKSFHNLFIFQATISHFEAFENAINELSSQITKPSIKNHKPKQILSFNWKELAKNQEGLKSLYNGLKSKSKIECSIKEFRDLFDDKLEFNQVIWLGSPTELIYLFYLLFENDFLVKKNSVFPHVQLKLCFDFNGNNSSKILSSIKNNNIKPKSHIIFENIVNSII